MYDAASGQASLLVNGTPAGTAAVPATFNGTGSFILGRALSGGTPDDYWDGRLSDVQTWAYALTPDQVTALYQQIRNAAMAGAGPGAPRPPTAAIHYRAARSRESRGGQLIPVW